VTTPVDAGRVLVAIPSRGRRDLVPTLRALTDQSAALGIGHGVDVVVLDNSGGHDPGILAAATQFGCRAEIVPKPGLAQVRNAAIELLAPGHASLLFLDDDEVPSAGWLREMLASHSMHGPAVVIGPVRVRTPPGAPRWLRSGDLLRREQTRPSGPHSGDTNSGNTLLDADFLRQTRLRFDERFDRSGGEDTDFFRRLRALGGEVFWAEGAAVVEYPDPERLTLSGLLRRAFHAGNLAWQFESESRSIGPLLVGLVRRQGRLVRGLGLALGGLSTGRLDRAARGLCDWATVAGTWASVAHLRTSFYD
jgi:succinoglycan biosynthesis protein ExoM